MLITVIKLFSSNGINNTNTIAIEIAITVVVNSC